MTALRWAVAAALACCAAPAAARTVDYERAEADLRAVATDLGVSDLLAVPARGSADLVVENVAGLDHRVTILGIYCRAWEVDNPLSRIVQRSLEGWDRDGALSPAPDRRQIVLRLEGARTTLRCVEAREMREQCLVRTMIDATATVTQPGEAPRVERFAIDAQHVQTPSMGCGGLSNGTAVAGWNASMRLLQRLGEISP